MSLADPRRLVPAPPSWHAAMYWSYGEPAWLGFIREDPGERYLVRHELTFHRVIPELAAVDILAFIERHNLAPLSGIVMQPELFPDQSTRGETVAESFWRFKVPVRRGSPHRAAGWSRLRSLLEPMDMGDGVKGATIRFHESCKILLATLPSLISEKMRDEILLTVDEFPARALGLFAMSRPGLKPKEARQLASRPDAIGHDVEQLRRSARSRV